MNKSLEQIKTDIDTLLYESGVTYRKSLVNAISTILEREINGITRRGRPQSPSYGIVLQALKDIKSGTADDIRKKCNEIKPMTGEELYNFRASIYHTLKSMHSKNIISIHGKNPFTIYTINEEN